VTFKGEFHELDDGGINPRPKSGRVPVWFGGHAEATFRRTAKYGDGFMPNRYPPGDDALAAAALRSAEACSAKARGSTSAWAWTA